MPFILIPDVFFRKSFDIIAIIQHFFPQYTLLLGCPTFSFGERINGKMCYKGILVQLRSCDEFCFCEDLDIISKQYQQEKIIFIPGEENTVRYFIKYLNKRPNTNFYSLLPDISKFETLCDKRKLAEFCHANNIAAPKFFDVNDIDSIPVINYPLLLKPCSGGGSRGIFRLFSYTDFSDYIRTTIKKEPYLLQSYIQGNTSVEGAFFLCHNGKVIGCHTHQRLLTNPPQGGVTVLSKYGKNETILSLGKNLLEKAHWNGLAMIEYLFDPQDNKYKVIEVNPRIWGSILLSEYSGEHLLVNYINLCLGNKICKCTIKEHAYIRWLFPVDMLNIFKKNRAVSWFNFKNTCFINWTYASPIRALWFNFQGLFSLKNILRFFR